VLAENVNTVPIAVATILVRKLTRSPDARRWR
jgi:hypothetical protein